MSMQDKDPMELVGLLNQLEVLMDQRQAAAEVRDHHAKLVDEHSDQIKAILKDLGLSRLVGVRFVANLSDSQRVTLSPELLMAAGVPMQIIKDSQKTTTVTTLKVTARKTEG